MGLFSCPTAVIRAVKPSLFRASMFIFIFKIASTVDSSPRSTAAWNSDIKLVDVEESEIFSVHQVFNIIHDYNSTCLSASNVVLIWVNIICVLIMVTMFYYYNETKRKIVKRQ